MGTPAILLERALRGIGGFVIAELARGIHDARVGACEPGTVVAEIEAAPRQHDTVVPFRIGLDNELELVARDGPHPLGSLRREAVLENREARLARGKRKPNPG